MVVGRPFDAHHHATFRGSGERRAIVQDGSADPGFGTGGTATVSFGSNETFAQDIALMPDGRIVVGGAFGHAGGARETLADR